MRNEIELSDSLLLEELTKRLTEKNILLKSQAEMLAEMEMLNERLRDVERVKSGFLSNIRNEINNPLTSILGLAQQITHGSITDVSKIKNIATFISKEAFNLDFQLRNIFSAAEIEAGEITPEPALVDINKLIQTQIHYFQYKAMNRGLTVHFEPSDINHFKTDGKLVQVIVMNLLANAFEFSPPEKSIEIKSQIDSNNILTITVKDFGQGISPEGRKHIFERFKQLDTGATKSHQGHGLGLSIVKEFADALRGKIYIDSEVGQFTSATIVLPAFEMSRLPEGFSMDGQEIIFGEEEIL